MSAPPTGSLRVLLYTEAPSHGGVTTVMESLVAGLADRYSFSCALPGAAAARLFDHPYVAQPVEFTDAALHHPGALRGWLDIPGCLRFAGFLRSVQPDIVHLHLHTPFSCQQAILMTHLLSRGRIVITEHYLSQVLFLRRKKRGPAVALLREIVIRMSLLIKKLLLRFVDQTIVLSPGDAELHAGMMGIEYGPKTAVIFNGIDADRFAEGRRGSLGMETGTINILTVAELNNQKGHRFLLEAIPAVRREIPNARFFFAGDGHLRDELRELSRSLGVEAIVTFLGRRDDVADLFASSDLVVLPSLFEGFPLTLLEAMAAGRAVVATDVPGNRDAVIHGETGLLVKAADPRALEGGIVRLLKDPELRATMGAQGQKRVRSLFTQKAMCEQTAMVYQRLLRDRQGR